MARPASNSPVDIVAFIILSSYSVPDVHKEKYWIRQNNSLCESNEQGVSFREIFHLFEYTDYNNLLQRVRKKLVYENNSFNDIINIEEGITK